MSRNWRKAMYCAVQSPIPCSASNRAVPEANSSGSSIDACATPDKVRPRLFGMPSAARSAFAKTFA